MLVVYAVFYGKIKVSYNADVEQSRLATLQEYMATLDSTVSFRIFGQPGALSYGFGQTLARPGTPERGTWRCTH